MTGWCGLATLPTLHIGAAKGCLAVVSTSRVQQCAGCMIAFLWAVSLHEHASMLASCSSVTSRPAALRPLLPVLRCTCSSAAQAGSYPCGHFHGRHHTGYPGAHPEGGAPRWQGGGVLQQSREVSCCLRVLQNSAISIATDVSGQLTRKVCVRSAAACRGSALPGALLNVMHCCLQVEWQAGHVGPGHSFGSRDLQGGVFGLICRSPCLQKGCARCFKRLFLLLHLTELCAACRAGQHFVEVISSQVSDHMQSVGLAEPPKIVKGSRQCLACQDLSTYCCWRVTRI